MITQNQNIAVSGVQSIDIFRTKANNICNVEFDTEISLDDIVGSAVDFNNLEQHTPLHENFINRGETIVIKAEKGDGSTWFAKAIALAIESATMLFGFYKYCFPPNGYKDIVLLFTSGIPVDTLDKRMVLMKYSSSENEMHIISKEYHSNRKQIFDLNSSDWRKKIIIALKKITDKHIILIFDSIDLLVIPDSKEDIEVQIEQFYNFIKEIHLNPNITQIWLDRGTNHVFNIPYEFIDLQLGLKSQKDRGNLTIEVRFIKSNGLKKDQTRPFVIELQEFQDEPKMRFQLKPAEIDKEQMAVVMMIEGQLTQKEIAEYFGVSQGTVSTWRARAIKNDFIQPSGHNNVATNKGNQLVETMRVYI